MTAGLLLAACGTRSTTTVESTVTVMMPLDEYGLNWHWSSQAQFLVFSPLVARNASGELEPRLATHWTHTPDYREWTVHLNPEARWHDGTSVTAHDVKFTLDAFIRARSAFIQHAYDVDVLTDHSYRIRYDRPGIGNPLDDYTVIYPQHLLSDVPPDGWASAEFWTHPVGSGPFRHVRTVEGIGFEFEANADYFRGRPRIDRVVLRFGVPQLQHLLSGDVDVLPYVSELTLLRLRDDPRFVAYRWPSAHRIKAVLWNHRSPMFGDRRVRRALTLAVDRRELMKVVGLDTGGPIVDGLYSDRQFRRSAFPAALGHDTVEAMALLEDAEWIDTDGDGVRERDGRSFRFDLVFSEQAGGWSSQGGEAVALFLQDQLRTVGIEVELLPLESGARRERVESGKFDAALDDVAALTRFQIFGADNPLGYTDRRVLRLIEAIRSAFDPDSVDFLYEAVSEILIQDQPVLFLYPVVATTIANRRLKGMSAPYRTDAIWYLEDLWIEESR